MTMSSTEYPVSVSSGNTASATLSSWQSRAICSTDSALPFGSAMCVRWVQAAMRAKPCRYAE
jgi:hypothetical protein